MRTQISPENGPENGPEENPETVLPQPDPMPGFARRFHKASDASEDVGADAGQELVNRDASRDTDGALQTAQRIVSPEDKGEGSVEVSEDSFFSLTDWELGRPATALKGAQWSGGVRGAQSAWSATGKASAEPAPETAAGPPSQTDTPAAEGDFFGSPESLIKDTRVAEPVFDTGPVASPKEATAEAQTGDTQSDTLSTPVANDVQAETSQTAPASATETEHSPKEHPIPETQVLSQSNSGAADTGPSEGPLGLGGETDLPLCDLPDSPPDPNVTAVQSELAAPDDTAPEGFSDLPLCDLPDGPPNGIAAETPPDDTAPDGFPDLPLCDLPDSPPNSTTTETPPDDTAPDGFPDLPLCDLPDSPPNSTTTETPPDDTAPDGFPDLPLGDLPDGPPDSLSEKALPGILMDALCNQTPDPEAAPADSLALQDDDHEDSFVFG